MRKDEETTREEILDFIERTHYFEGSTHLERGYSTVWVTFDEKDNLESIHKTKYDAYDNIAGLGRKCRILPFKLFDTLYEDSYRALIEFLQNIHRIESKEQIIDVCHGILNVMGENFTCEEQFARQDLENAE